MKSAKEWAESVVNVVDSNVTIEDDCGWVEVEDQFLNNAGLRETAIGIIERLVERVQADARSPLEAALAEVHSELRRLRRVAHHGSTAEDICERLLPRIEEALR